MSLGGRAMRPTTKFLGRVRVVVFVFVFALWSAIWSARSDCSVVGFLLMVVSVFGWQAAMARELMLAPMMRGRLRLDVLSGLVACRGKEPQSFTPSCFLRVAIC